MRLSSRRSDDCWSSHILTSVVDLSRFIWDLRERHLEFWTSYSDGCPREHNSKILTYNTWCALPPKKALAIRSPYSLPKYMFLDLPQDVVHSVARFRLRVHTLRFETATWNPAPPVPVICVRLVMMSRMNILLFSTDTPQFSVSSQEIWVLILRGKSTGCFYFFAPEQQTQS